MIAPQFYAMNRSETPRSDDVEHLLRNAQLRDALETALRRIHWLRQRKRDVHV